MSVQPRNMQPWAPRASPAVQARRASRAAVRMVSPSGAYSAPLDWNGPTLPALSGWPGMPPVKVQVKGEAPAVVAPSRRIAVAATRDM